MSLFGSNTRYSLLGDESTHKNGQNNHRRSCFQHWLTGIWVRLRTNRVLSVIIIICSSLFLVYLLFPSHQYRSNAAPFNDVRIIPPPPLTNGSTLEHIKINDDGLHVLLPASNPEVNLCKTLLGLSILGYPNPSLIGWKEDPEIDGLLGGGTHLNKITLVLEYLNTLSAEQDGDLVFMLDAYDIWLQLPPSTLISRYHAVVQRTQAELAQRIGRSAVDQENLYTSIIFGAGKRCAPNQHHEIACLTPPESGLPNDLYGLNTDTLIGHSLRGSHRQRFLNSGYVIGPVADMRKLFQEAQRVMDEHPHQDPADNGSHGSDNHYHGSDQSIFAKVFGRQEWVREHHRIRHVSIWNRLLHPLSWPTKPRSTQIYGLHVDNVLEPSFTHEHLDSSFADSPYEFGMTLDYWSDFGLQEINSEFDGRWLVHVNDETSVDGTDYPDPSSLRDQIGVRNGFDCKLALPSHLPTDITASKTRVDDMMRWTDVGLFTHICLARIPIMLHHNGDKSARVRDWHNMWYVVGGKARQFLSAVAQKSFAKDPPLQQRPTQNKSQRLNRIHESRQASTQIPNMVVAQTDKGKAMTWGALCPVEWDGEIFREQA